MKEKERMLAGFLYNPLDEEIKKEQFPYLDKLREFNKLTSKDLDKREKYMKEVFASCGDNSYIEIPFYANWGGHHLHLGSNVYANFNLTLVDDGNIFIKDNVMIGPNVTIITASHPINAELRMKEIQFNRNVIINENVWIGANVTILPGVTIGKNSVIGAASVVTKDVPENVVVVGNPARVMRKISSRDDEYFYKNEKIDWENLK